MTPLMLKPAPFAHQTGPGSGQRRCVGRDASVGRFFVTGLVARFKEFETIG